MRTRRWKFFSHRITFVEMTDYERIIPAVVGPKLAYHGFKYDETSSYPPQGDYTFSRSYWCTTQRVSIGPLEYDPEEIQAVLSRGEDLPTEIAGSLLRIKESGFRLWLSNRYLNAVLQSDHRSINVIPNYGIFEHRVKNDALASISPTSHSSSLPTVWEFHGEDDLRRTLTSIVAIIVNQGLDWFEDQIIDVKRYHEKLERRRRSAKRTKGKHETTES